MISASIFTCLFFHFLVYRIDWMRVITKALARLQNEEVSSDPDDELHDMPSPGRLDLDREFSYQGEDREEFTSVLIKYRSL